LKLSVQPEVSTWNLVHDEAKEIVQTWKGRARMTVIIQSNVCQNSRCTISVRHCVHCATVKKGKRQFTYHLFSWITAIKTNMLLITFLGLVATLTSVSGDCHVGTQDVKDFDFNKVGIVVLTWFLEQAADNVSAWFDISFVVPLTKSQ